MDPKSSVSGALHSLTLEMPAGVWPSGKPGAWGGKSREGLVWGWSKFLSSRGEGWGAWGWLRNRGEGGHLCPLQGGLVIIGPLCRLGCPTGLV